MGTTAYQAKYFAYALTREGGKGVERLQQSLLNASVDLNPHQVEAALFALRSPISKGVLLADEVGLGKTIEAGLVMCQLWAERKRRILVVCPASLRKQWQCELEDKFNLPCVVIDAKAAEQLQKEGFSNPFDKPSIHIVSYQFAAKRESELLLVPWNLVVFDEAHKLRNCYQPSNTNGKKLRRIFADRRKLLLTATPLQNSLLELYGLATFLDDKYFGGTSSDFRRRYENREGDLTGLRTRLKEFTWRTLRKEVQGFVKYTERRPVTEDFESSAPEMLLYEAVSDYLREKMSYAFPARLRPLLTMLVRKVMASSTYALIGTLEHILDRLERIRRDETIPDSTTPQNDYLGDPDLMAELEENGEDQEEEVGEVPEEERDGVDLAVLDEEIERVKGLLSEARQIGTDTKTKHLLTALETGWGRMREVGAPEKAVVFTESRRTMEYLRQYLEANGYAGQVVCFSGNNEDPTANRICNEYRAAHPDEDSSRAVMMRHALIEAFKNRAKILLATEAGAEGINLQFCSLLVNYDLPWNPQRVEQRIGRCHRYGQKFNVVVVNFRNTSNAADCRVFELLSAKLQLFEGLFGASDEVIGAIAQEGKSFERQINDILQQCRTAEEINAAFDELQNRLQDKIAAARAKTHQDIVENLDEEVRKVLKDYSSKAEVCLTESEKRFLAMSRQVLAERVEFLSDDDRSFKLLASPAVGIPAGEYALKPAPDSTAIPYRLSSPLGEWALAKAKTLATPYAKITFDMSGYTGRIAVVEELVGKAGYLRLDRMGFEGAEAEDFLLFAGFTDEGQNLDPEVSEKLFNLSQTVSALPDGLPPEIGEALDRKALQQAQATEAEVEESNNRHYKEETEKLLRWSEDQITAAAEKLDELRDRKIAVERKISEAGNLEEQLPYQQELETVRREIRRAREEIAAVEDETDDRRAAMLTDIKRRLTVKATRETLFTIKWEVV